MRRTPDITIDKDFTVTGEIVKAFVDSKTGERHIVGAASGLEEDKDGERVSKNAISGMVKKVGEGNVHLTASHQQDWWSEIGTAREAHVDDETHQLMVDTVLPPEGVDPISDKAWKTAQKERLGFSIGGKLRHAFYELSDLGKKRKVLDSIDLRHVALTKNPSYTPSFAEAIAKTFEEPVEESDFVEEDLIKANLTTGSWAGGSYGESGNSGQDSQTGGQRNAGKKKRKRKGLNEQTEDQQSEEGDEDEEEDNPEEEGEEGQEEVVPTERHMACPNCGHEFAADLPIDMSQQEREKFDRPEDKGENEEPEDEGDENEPNAEGAKPDEESGEEQNRGKKNRPPTKKSKGVIMDLKKVVLDLQERVAAEERGEAVGKIDPDTEPETVEVYKIVAASHGMTEEQIEKTRNEMSEGFEIVGKAVMELRELVSELPLGRKSQARVLPEATGHEDGMVGKTATETLKDDASPLEALKAINADAYGIR